MQKASQVCASGSGAVLCIGCAMQRLGPYTGQHPTPVLCNAGASQSTHASEGPPAVADSDSTAAGYMRSSSAAAAAAASAPEVSASSMSGSSMEAAMKSAGEPQTAGTASAAPAVNGSASATDPRRTSSTVKPEEAAQLAVRAGGTASGPAPSTAAPAAGKTKGASQPAGRTGDSSGPDSHALAPEDWLDLASVPPSGYATRQGSGLLGHEGEGRSPAGPPTRMVGACNDARLLFAKKNASHVQRGRGT